jgi:hypothetical protein
MVKKKTAKNVTRRRGKKAAKPPLVGGNKKPVPAVNVVVDVVRQNVLGRLDISLRKMKRVPPLAFSLPDTLEYAFAKRPGKKPVDISTKQEWGRVWSRSLRKGEKFHIHIHPFYSPPSSADLANVVYRIIKHGKILNSIVMIDSAKAKGMFIKGILKNGYRQVGKRLVPKVSIAELRGIAMAEAKKAVNQIVPTARVSIKPTEVLLKMRKKKMFELHKHFLTMAQYEREYYHFGKLIETADFEGPKTITELRAKSKKHVAKTWGDIFNIRLSPMPGYRYDKKDGTYVKV